jgi:hypothetical protein
VGDRRHDDAVAIRIEQRERVRLAPRVLAVGVVADQCVVGGCSS